MFVTYLQRGSVVQNDYLFHSRLAPATEDYNTIHIAIVLSRINRHKSQ